MEVSILPLERLTRLYDSLEQIEDDGWDDEGSEQDSNEDYSEGLWLQDGQGVWRYEKNDDDEWEETDEEPNDMEVDGPWAETESSPAPDDDSLNSLPRNVTPDLADSVSPLPISPSTTSPDMSQEMVVDSTAKESDEIDQESAWKRFEILSSAPADHAFFSTSSSQFSRTFLARLTKEYRALSNSLPGAPLVEGARAVMLTIFARLHHRSCLRESIRSSAVFDHWTGEHPIRRRTICHRLDAGL
jgi:ubiquitin-conjugating enzyme E2 O